MTDFMELLYHYVRTNRFPGCLPPRAYKEVTQIEERTLSALGPFRSSRGGPEAIPGRQRGTAALELEAMFLAAFAAARELCRV